MSGPGDREVDIDRFLENAFDQNIDGARQTGTAGVLRDDAFYDVFVDEYIELRYGDLGRELDLEKRWLVVVVQS
jgi:hypothetical protein